MGHTSRCREPETWQHVMVRGVSRRSMFDRDADANLFSDRIARSVDRGDLAIVAFCLMPNHAHLIVRSPTGRLGDAMRDIEAPYVRRFNPPRDRKGPLVQARYRAKPIRTRRYMSAAIAYIDQNAVEAGLVVKPADYPHGSARHYARTTGPPWLDRSWVEAYLRVTLEPPSFSPATYARVFGTRTSASARRWFASAMEAPGGDPPSLDALIQASPEHILRWMDEQARSADGTVRIVPVADMETVVECVAALPEEERTRCAVEGGRARSTERILAAGLLRRLSGAPHLEIGSRTSQSPSSARLCILDHDRALTEHEWYRALVGRVSRAILDRCHPSALPTSCAFVSDTFR